MRATDNLEKIESQIMSLPVSEQILCSRLHKHLDIMTSICL